MYKLLYSNHKFKIKKNKCKILEQAMQNCIDKKGIKKEIIISNKTFLKLQKQTNVIKKKLIKYSQQFLRHNYHLNLDIPIKIKYKTYARYNAYTLGFFKYRIKDHKPLNIELNALLIYKSIINNNFNDVYDTLKHELIHYALFCKNQAFHDGDNNFEIELIKKQVSTSSTTVIKNKNIKPIKHDTNPYIYLYDLYNVQLHFNVNGKNKIQNNITFEHHKQRNNKQYSQRVCVVINIF